MCFGRSIDIIRETHKKDHRKAETVHETLIRQNIENLFKEVNCEKNFRGMAQYNIIKHTNSCDKVKVHTDLCSEMDVDLISNTSTIDMRIWKERRFENTLKSDCDYRKLWQMMRVWGVDADLSLSYINDNLYKSALKQKQISNLMHTNSFWSNHHQVRWKQNNL